MLHLPPQAPQRSKKAKVNSNSPAKKLAVLDLKRATGIGIRMARLSVPWQRIREAIMTCDEDVLRTSDDVETVLACLPTEEEMRMLQVGHAPYSTACQPHCRPSLTRTTPSRDAGCCWPGARPHR